MVKKKEIRIIYLSASCHDAPSTRGKNMVGHLRPDQPALTCMCEYVPLEVVAASESAIAVVTDEILLHFQGKVIVHVHWWKDVL